MKIKHQVHLFSYVDPNLGIFPSFKFDLALKSLVIAFAPIMLVFIKCHPIVKRYENVHLFSLRIFLCLFLQQTNLKLSKTLICYMISPLK